MSRSWTHLFFTLPLLLGSSSVFAAVKALPSYAPAAHILRPQGMSFELLSSYLRTQGFYDYDGHHSSLPEGSAFDRLQNEARIRYGMGKTWEFDGAFRFRVQKSVVQTSDGQSYESKSAGPESLMAGVKIALPPTAKGNYSIFANVRGAIFSNDPYNPSQPYQNLVLGDEGYHLTLGALSSYVIAKRSIAELMIAYSKPSSRLSDEILYDAHLAWVASSVWAFILGIDGVHSLKNDEYSSNPENKPLENTGATHLYNSVNREYLAPYIQLNCATSKNFRFELKTSSVVSGYSTDQYWEYSLNLVWNKGGKEAKEERPQQYKEYTIEATVTQVSSQGKFIKIDQGLADDVEKGMKVDIYKFDYLGGNELLASGRVMEVSGNSAIVKIETIYKPEIPIKAGFEFKVRGNH